MFAFSAESGGSHFKGVGVDVFHVTSRPDISDFK